MIRINKHVTQLSIVLIVVCLFAGCKVGLDLYSSQVNKALSSKVIRFHVVANSDTVEDQLLKQQVRDEIISYMEPMLEDSTSIEQTRSLIEQNKETIEELAQIVVKRNAKDYPVYVGLDYANFPTKSYGDIVFPAGRYEACRIIIGEGKGENWWCVMYPPLCYVDASNGVVPIEGKEELKKELNKEQYNLVAHANNREYHIRFKIVDSINKRLHKANYKEVPR
ncbi:stage II sporulation protein R [Sporanaerobium hydrogeniformans]|uniref:Stage II sporulation protein R n=1 Tax=Sporanaerobium hydrogeniformans TaxID=3072179 RepID=A0AC61DBJ6_9FIRM|nr:stage II sporulation protein R [Sporanaerobium hydrogeniformans]PHV70135.1 stage II sporulation protein R [Sporanaerobium hydrogeniformans]